MLRTVTAALWPNVGPLFVFLQISSSPWKMAVIKMKYLPLLSHNKSICKVRGMCTVWSWSPLDAVKKKDVYSALLFLYRRQQYRYSDWLRDGLTRGWSSSPVRVKDFQFYLSPRQALELSQLPVLWIPAVPSPSLKRQGRDATHSLQLVLKSRKRGHIYQLPHTPSCCSA